MSETDYRLLKLIETKPHLTQRDLAREMGVSLGKINYCLSALVAKGWVKARNFRSSRNKLGYAYLLTPRGIEQKAVLTVNFLHRKMAEFDALTEEIAQMQREVDRLGPRERP